MPSTIILPHIPLLLCVIIGLGGCALPPSNPSTPSPSSPPAHVSSNHFDRLFRRMGKLSGDLTWKMSQPPQHTTTQTLNPRTSTDIPDQSASAMSTAGIEKPSLTTSTVHHSPLPPCLKPSPITPAMHNTLWRAACVILEPLGLEKQNDGHKRLRTQWTTCSHDPQQRMRFGVWIDARHHWDHAVTVQAEHQKWQHNQWKSEVNTQALALEMKESIMRYARTCWVPSAQSVETGHEREVKP